MRDSILDGPKTAFEAVTDLVGPDVSPATATWGLQIALAYLDHLEAQGEIASEQDGETVRWSVA